MKYNTKNKIALVWYCDVLCFSTKGWIRLFDIIFFLRDKKVFWFLKKNVYAYILVIYIYSECRSTECDSVTGKVNFFYKSTLYMYMVKLF